ncbi:tail fiber assembly protein [Lelliottia wanjuensis]|uniref:tail fiber assembly protein n=1 Tax=Lelliottia wanjuensis TaxID=3050585 RepID=UPI00254FB11B|nr:tail fiber assembly protein [Lelliottia sp. V86_10]MDK9585409.1 tail fiber assembly protein [Lelliottia sp. V86_10]
MGKIFYSASKRGFFLEEDKAIYEDASGWPMDALEISQQMYEDLLSGQSNGQQIIPDATGYPVLVTPEVDPTVVTAQNTDQFNRLLIATSAAAFPLQSAVTLGIATSEDQSALAALQQYAIDLANTDLSQNPAAFPAAPAGVKLPI